MALLAKGELLGGPLMRLEFGRPMGPFSSPGPFGNYSAVIAMACLAGWLGGAGLRGGPREREAYSVASAALKVALGRMAADSLPMSGW